MENLNEELLHLIKKESLRLDTRVEARVKRRGIILKHGDKPSTTKVTVTDNNFIVEVMARPSIRLRDAGVGRYYNKGKRQFPPKYGQRVFYRRQNRIINRPMFELIHRLQEMGIKTMGKVIVKNLDEFIKKWH